MTLRADFEHRFGSGPETDRAYRLLRATSARDALMAALVFDEIHEDPRGTVPAYQALCLQLAHDLNERDQT